MSGFFTIKIEDKEKSVSFGPRRLGDKGLDILAVKIALGLILSTESITNESPQDPAIKEGGKQWFSCTENENISLSLSRATSNQQARISTSKPEHHHHQSQTRGTCFMLMPLDLDLELKLKVKDYAR